MVRSSIRPDKASSGNSVSLRCKKLLIFRSRFFEPIASPPPLTRPTSWALIIVYGSVAWLGCKRASPKRCNNCLLHSENGLADRLRCVVNFADKFYQLIRSRPCFQHVMHGTERKGFVNFALIIIVTKYNYLSIGKVFFGL